MQMLTYSRYVLWIFATIAVEMFVRLPFEVRLGEKFFHEKSKNPSCRLWLRGFNAETASKFPLDNAATCTTVPLLHRDFIELNLSSETYTSAHNDSNSAELLLRWLQLFQLPNSSGRTIRQLQSKISIVMTQYRRLVKNYNARAKRNGKNQAKALENFLNSSFVWAGQIGNGRVFQTPLSRDEPPQPCKVAPSSSDELSHAPPTFAPLLPELCEGPDEPSFKTPEDLTSHLDSTALQQNQVPQPSPCAPQSCPVTPQLAPDQTYPSASSVDQSQMSIDVSSPSSVPGPPGFQASPVARPRNIFSTPDQRCPATLPHCSTPDQTCPGLDLSQSPVTSLGSAPTPPDKDPVAPTLRCGKHRPSPDAYVLQQKLLKANRKNDRLFKENTTLQNLVGVRCRDAVKQVEKEKVDAVAEVRKELTKEIKRTSGELKAAVSRSTKLEKENVALRAQCIEFMDVAEEKEKEANKFVKYGKKVAREKHNLQKKVLRKDVKVQGLLQNFETDANIADKLHAEIVAKLKKENEDLNCRLKQLQALETKQGKRYNAEIRLVYYDLLTKGVSCNIIESVVRRVLETLSGQDVKGTALPSRSTAQRMKVEAGYLVKLRLAWEWKQRADRSAVFQTDKTTKGQLEWLSIVVKLRPNDNEDSTFTLCLEPVSSGTSECTLGTFRKCLDQLCDIAIKHNIATYDEAKRIYSISNIVGHMSDRAATETKLTRILIEEKANLLREEGLSVEEAQRRAKVYNFTCSLHKINNTAVAMTQAAEKHLQFDNEEHLPGGEYYWDDFNPRLAKAASIVGDSTNNAVEGRFASVDNQMNRCRRSNPLSVGGNVSAKHDHIVDFLDNQDKDAQEELCLSAMKGGREMALKKGTKNQQLKRLYEEGEPARQAKRLKAQERKKKAEDKRKATQQALANGELVQDAGKLDATLSVSDLKKQCQLWQSVGANATVQQVDLLKGYYKKSKPQLLAILREVVEHNSHLDMIPHQSDGESEAESSSSDEDDLALA